MIALITPTGGRQKQIELCAIWMKHQTYTGKVLWILVDDCVPVTSDCIPDDFREGWTIVKLYPTPSWQRGQRSTQSRNLSAALREVKKYKDVESIFIIEDDDYYKSIYLERMMEKIKGFNIAGERDTIYYNVAARKWSCNPNHAWSSLFQTVISIDAMHDLQKCFNKEKFIDFLLFRRIQSKNLFNDDNLAVGIKGLPGRAGMGMGHSRIDGMEEDPNWEKLIELLGEDAKYYIS